MVVWWSVRMVPLVPLLVPVPAAAAPCCSPHVPVIPVRQSDGKDISCVLYQWDVGFYPGESFGDEDERREIFIVSKYRSTLWY